MDYKKLALKSLREARVPKQNINESIRYAEGHNERMNPRLEKELRERKHSLGDHPIFPQSDEKNFEQRIMGDRFEDVMKNYKSKFDVEVIDNNEAMQCQGPLVKKCMDIEGKHRKALEELAVSMIRDEYNISEDIVDITAELVEDVSLEGTQREELPTVVEVEFDDHNSIQKANDNVYKRRFLNAMTQGAAKKSSHMFHLVDKELTNLDPTLVNKYGKLMAAADYSYFIEPDMHNTMSDDNPNIGKTKVGGIVSVTLPTDENPKCHIHAQAMVFPVLIHELVKGVMEILSAHGLPEEENIAEYVIGKSDFLAAESWDMRLGPALWDRFTRLIPADDFNLKHNIYSELAALPVNEFNEKMREVMAGTKAGQQIITDMCESCKSRIENDNYRDEIGDDDSDGFSLNDLNDIDINDIL